MEGENMMDGETMKGWRSFGDWLMEEWMRRG